MAKKYTYYNTATQTVIATGRPWPTADGVSTPPGLAANVVLLEQVNSDKPTYDQWTEKLEKDAIVYDVPNLQAVQGWSVAALTQVEIDDRTPEHVEISGIKYDTSEQSQNALTRMMTLVTQSGMASTDEVAVKDCLGVSHTLTVEEFTADMVQFGLFCYTQFHA